MAWRSHLVPDWRQAHRLWSVQLTVFAAILDGLWLALPVMQDWFPPFIFIGICVGMSLAILAARLIDQKDVPYGDTPNSA